MVVKRRLRGQPQTTTSAWTTPTRETLRCGLCGRLLPDDASVDQHHLVPRSQGGRGTVAMHRVCHQKIHSVLAERELADRYSTFEALRTHPELQRFIEWVANKPLGFNDRSRRRRR